MLTQLKSNYEEEQYYGYENSFLYYCIESLNLSRIKCFFKGHTYVNHEIPDVENGPNPDVSCSCCGTQF